MKIVSGLLALALVALPASALARGSGRHHSGSHGTTHSHSSATEFRTGHCKSAKCYKKHPGGTYVHPITPRKRR